MSENHKRIKQDNDTLRQLKKRNIKQELFSNDTLFNITEYLEDLKDFISLSLVCKDHYNYLLNNKDLIAFSNFFVIHDYSLLLEKDYFELSNDSNSYKFISNKLPKCLFYSINDITIRHYNSQFNYLQFFKKFTKFNSLTIFDTNLKGDEFNDLKLENINFLTIKACKFTDIFLYNFKNLIELHMNFSNTINGESLQYLTKLEALTACRTNIKDDHLKNLINLRELNIKHCKQITGECFQNLNKLQILNISYSKLIKDEHLKDLQNLTELNIECCTLITGECFVNLINLEILRANFTNVKDEHLKNLINLTDLEINCCDSITGEFLMNIPNLESIRYTQSGVQECLKKTGYEDLIY
ncbi:hypothetical protein ABK040_008938 [Willaertia magna]